MDAGEMCLKQRMEEEKSLRRKLGPCYERLGTPWFHPRGSLIFISPVTQRSNKDKGTGWRDGNQPGHERKQEVKLALPRKAEMR